SLHCRDRDRKGRPANRSRGVRHYANCTIWEQGMGESSIIRPGDLTEAGEGVFYSPRPLPIIDQRLIDFLKETARATPRRRARFCAHPSAETDQHDMLIVAVRDTYIAPHRHLAKSESLVVLEGEVDIVLFDDDGAVTEIVAMGPVASGRPFLYR